MVSVALRSFIAGFVSTLVFHQTVIWFIARASGLPFKTWNMAPNSYGVPSVLALAFWAGVWGIALCAVIGARRWSPALVWGAVLGGVVPSVWGWTVLASIHGKPMFSGGNMKIIIFVLFVNAVWGAGTVLLFKAMQGGRMRLAT